MTRDYDIALFGATGFVGELTADYLAQHAPAQARIAIAGRNAAKLEALKTRLGRPELGVLVADVEDAASITALAQAARVVISTVGPYLHYGEPLVAACAAAGTDYVDLTGEPEFVDLMYLRYHAVAKESGARLVHSCGFDSIPYDLGALFTVSQLPDDVPIALRGFGMAQRVDLRRHLPFGGPHHGAPEGGRAGLATAAVGRAYTPRTGGSPRGAACAGSRGGRTTSRSPAAGLCRRPRSIHSTCCVVRGWIRRTARTSRYSHFLVTKRLARDGRARRRRRGGRDAGPARADTASAAEAEGAGAAARCGAAGEVVLQSADGRRLRLRLLRASV